MSTRAIDQQLGIFQSTYEIPTVSKPNMFLPFAIYKVIGACSLSTPNDFSSWFLQQSMTDSAFAVSVLLFMDEASFTREGNFNHTMLIFRF